MKAALVLCCLLVQADIVQPVPIQVSVTLNEGKVLVGRVQQSFDLDATFGKAQIDPDKIASIRFGKVVVVKTTDNTTLRGRLVADTITLKTDDGEQHTLKLADLKSLQTIQRAVLAAGEVSNGRSANGMTYHARMPPDFQPGQPDRPAIIIFHGSNMNSLSYVNSIVSQWPDIAKKYILIGINGENASRSSTDQNPRYNYSYVNFVGKSTYKGFPGTDRESPALVAEVVAELRAYVPIERLFVGGHSQGGYLTYSVIMNYPDLFDGAFPISGAQIFQAEPTAYDNQELRELQRQKPIAIVHGETDPSVRFSAARGAYENYLDDSFPMVKLFAHKTAGHRFIFLPVPDAIGWLEDMTNPDPAAVIDLAAARIESGEIRDGISLLNRVALLDKDNTHQKRIDAVRQPLEQKAGPIADRLAKAITANENAEWIDEFLKFRSQYEFLESAKPAISAYAKLREQHAKPANDLYNAARRDFRAGRKDAGYEKYKQVIDRHYASKWYPKMKRWLAERK